MANSKPCAVMLSIPCRHCCLDAGKAHESTSHRRAECHPVSQVVTLLHTIASNIPRDNKELRRMLVLGPVNTMHNWKAELKRFLPSTGHTAVRIDPLLLAWTDPARI